MLQEMMVSQSIKMEMIVILFLLSLLFLGVEMPLVTEVWPFRVFTTINYINNKYKRRQRRVSKVWPFIGAYHKSILCPIHFWRGKKSFLTIIY